MRYIYHHRTAGRGGEGIHITSVVHALRAAGHDVDLVSPPGIDPIRAAALSPLDKGAQDPSGIVRLWQWVSCSCPQAFFEVFELLYNVYAVLRLLPLFLRRRQAVYYQRHAFFLFAGVWLAKCFGMPVILEVNEVAGVERARAQRWVRLARWLGQHTFRRADEIITVSRFLQRTVLERGGRPGHVHVVPNAIDPERFRRRQGSVVRERLGLSQARVLGFLGWFDRWDRLDRLIDLMQDLRHSHPDVRLLLVGDGPAACELSDRIAQENLTGHFIFAGPVARSDVADYLDAMDICILPDATEFCSPLVLFEFMAMGKPVVAPDVEPICDVLVHGRTGCIFERGDHGALRVAVENLLNDRTLAKGIGEAARQDVLAQHTWRAVAEFVERLAVPYVEAGGRTEHAARQPKAALARPETSVLAFLRNFHL